MVGDTNQSGSRRGAWQQHAVVFRCRADGPGQASAQGDEPRIQRLSTEVGTEQRHRDGAIIDRWRRDGDL